LPNTKARSGTKNILIAIGVLIIPVIWFAASRIAGGYIIPEPWTTISDTILLLGRSDTWQTILISIGRVCFGFAGALLLGVVVGIASVKSTVEYLLRPMILLMQGVPPILWSIPLILIMGWSRLTPVVVIALICFPLVATTLSEGMRTVPRELREMLDVFAPGFFPRLRELILPHLKPFIAAAVRLGLGLGIKASVIAEYFAANNGIGFEVQTAYQAFLVRKLFSWALILILLIFLADLAVRGVFRAISAFPGPRKKLPEEPIESASEIRSRIGAYADRRSIVLNKVSFSYPGGGELLAGLDLSIGPEEIAVLSGDSGNGKTTLLKIIAGLAQVSGGYVHSPEDLGFIFQDDRFLPTLNCVSNAALGLYYRDHTWSESRDYARYLMDQVGLAGKELALPKELSGGMSKRLAFARGFACLPGALLLDEPFTGLHHEARVELWSRFSALVRQRPVPVLIVTHFPEEVPRGEHTSFYELSGTPAKLKST
jgi:ABC-type nitrate/sulfonate/bicarbonate transport system ATPase subunit/ABC-type nitrate/sulfonate/bicarbonate transport system permease component